MLFYNPRPVFSPQTRSSKSGFTLIELLMVIAVILILASITFGISRGVQNAQARAQTKAELATLSQALEQFKLRYGDYPWHDSDDSDTSKILLYALTGRVSMDRDPVTGKIVVEVISEDMDNADVKKRPKFIDIEAFSLDVGGSKDSDEALAILDPWGNPYIYWYKWEATPEKWDVFGYHLYSTGPNGSSANNSLKAKMEDQDTGVWGDGYREVANENGIIFTGE